jgi:hypothetical protein
VRAGIKLGHQAEWSGADDGRILGDDEFVDATIHRIGQINRADKNRVFLVACVLATVEQRQYLLMQPE